MQIGLTEAIKALRTELAQAVSDGEGQPVRLRVESVKLDMQVAVTASTEADGGVKFWVLSLGGKTTEGVTGTHTVSLEFTAETADGGTVLTNSGRRTALED
ncbi:trypco2 family protein [Streptomyces sp.]|uniref:trypco2 family protein n=1 Tax=Streptomyces sp. TaxID=1931 RepID=UPI002D4AF764|nr:trypco2 family protein [Streptomyces sp.]HZF92541.1 trypco2 family protein [Streptomyces sp.]